ncbi:hypothetical protein ABZZ79_17820 [Streptomyces sp. NPDC006458]|uniref:hypothetical protein n=1 Tax=Streptomyces sp. NPDC006458 TaxID=3154302 RepID=UPI0033AD92E9
MRRKRGVNDGRFRPPRRFPLVVPVRRTSSQEFTMADLAFVVATIAAFALVAFLAQGVTKL